MRTCVCLTICWSLAASVLAQEIRRALPVNEPPTPPAVPFDLEPSPTPKAQPASAAPPTVSDETGARTLPTPIESTVSSSTPDQIQLEFANGFYARKLYETAAPEYEKYLETYANAPERQTALFRLGECYRILGRTEDARNAYQTLVTTFGIGEFIGPAAYRLADLYYAVKNYDAALTYYRKASVRMKDPAVALAAKFYSARCLENIDSPGQARIVYDDILSTKGDNPFREASRLGLAQILAQLDRREEAVQQFELLATETTRPEIKAEARVRAGLLKIDIGQAEKGAVDLNEALKMPEIGQWQSIAEIGLLRVLYETGKYQQLLDTYASATATLPDNVKPEVLLLAANSKRQLGDFAGARTIYDQVTQDFGDTVYAKEAGYERLVSLYNADDPALPAAVDQYLAAPLEPEKSDQVLLLKAEYLFKQQKYEEAAPLYAQLAGSKLSATLKAEAIFKLGWCEMQTQESEKAITAFTEFLDANPQHKLVPSALAQRAVAEQQTKNFKAALTDFDEVIRRFPKAKERELALQQKALILGQQQDNAGMAGTFKELLNTYPHSAAAAQANYWIGWTAFEAKDYQAALAPLEAARKIDAGQFFERASLRILLAHYYLENSAAVAADIATYTHGAPKGKVPTEVLRWLGTAELEAQNYAEAEKHLEQVTQREGETAVDDWLNLGRAQLCQQKFEDAVKSLGTFLAGNPPPLPRATALLALSEANLGLKKYDEAQKSADEACTLQPEGKLNAQGRLLSGDIAAARGDFDQASKIYRSISVIIDDPEITPKALEKACNMLKKSGNDAEAAKVLNQLQTHFPEYQLSSNKSS